MLFHWIVTSQIKVVTIWRNISFNTSKMAIQLKAVNTWYIQKGFLFLFFCLYPLLYYLNLVQGHRVYRMKKETTYCQIFLFPLSGIFSLTLYLCLYLSFSISFRDIVYINVIYYWTDLLSQGAYFSIKHTFSLSLFAVSIDSL